MMRFWLITLTALFVIAPNAAEARKVALVIGNSAYTSVPPLANPQLSLVATYHALVPGWQRLFDAQSASWPGFWQAAQQLAKLPADTRLACLRSEQSCP